MDECSDKTTDDTVSESVLQPEMSVDETVLTLFLSTTLSAVAMQLLLETAGNNDFQIIVHGPQGDRLGLEAGIDLYSEMLVLEERLLPVNQFMYVDVKDVILLPNTMEELPYWKQVNDHPHGPGQNRRKGGKHPHAQKRQR